jgi:hypothetical protein
MGRGSWGIFPSSCQSSDREEGDRGREGVRCGGMRRRSRGGGGSVAMRMAFPFSLFTPSDAGLILARGARTEVVAPLGNGSSVPSAAGPWVVDANAVLDDTINKHKT